MQTIIDNKLGTNKDSRFWNLIQSFFTEFLELLPSNGTEQLKYRLNWLKYRIVVLPKEGFQTDAG